jgi:hypothetical protein
LSFLFRPFRGIILPRAFGYLTALWCRNHGRLIALATRFLAGIVYSGIKIFLLRRIRFATCLFAFITRGFAESVDRHPESPFQRS